MQYPYWVHHRATLFNDCKFLRIEKQGRGGSERKKRKIKEWKDLHVNFGVFEMALNGANTRRLGNIIGERDHITDGTNVLQIHSNDNTACWHVLLGNLKPLHNLSEL